MLFNYVAGNILANEKKYSRNRFSKKSILTFSIISNIALIAYFKYSDFFIQNVNYVFNSKIQFLNLALPLAISFFTFQQIAYLVDSYRQETTEYDFLNYSVFVTFFPQLIAGPIVHHKEMMPQFETLKNKVVNYKNISLGLFIFSAGLFKKVVIADKFAIWATNGFDASNALTLLDAWITSLSYSFQLYFDFSGYTDMAIGLALLFNIKLPINFNSPYKAKNIQEFWSRWHITLSRFLKDYIYIPLGGNRKGNFRTYYNLLATFILGGLWHGAGWTFIFWGALNGFALIIHRVWSKSGFKLWSWLRWFITFNFLNIAWVFFRAKEWNDAIQILKSMFSLDGLVLPEFLEKNLSFLSAYGIFFGQLTEGINGDDPTIIWIFSGFVIVLFFKNSIEHLENFKLNYKTALLSGIYFVVSVLSLNKVSEFLYFNF